MLPKVPGYLVERYLAAGAQAQLWAGRDLASGRRVALRVCEVLTPEQRNQLRDAADAWAALSHPHLATVHDVLEVEHSLVVVLDLLEGGRFSDVIHPGRAVPAGQVVTALAPVALALSAIHEAGVVHGDLSPANILFDRDGRPRLADLGSALTLAGSARSSPGTAAVAAPEQVRCERPCSASDVWALAAVAFIALTGDRDAGGVLTAFAGAASGGGAAGGVAGSDATSALLWAAGVESVVADTVTRWPALEPLPGEVLGGLIKAVHPDPSCRPDAEHVASLLFALAAPEPVALSGLAATAAPWRTNPSSHTADPEPGLTGAGEMAGAGVVGERLGEAADDSPLGRLVRTARRAGAPKMGATTLAVALAGLLLWWAGGPREGAGTAQRAVAPVFDPVAVCGRAQPASDAVPAEPADWTAVVAALERSRAEAFEGGEPHRLCDVYSSTSPGLAQDLAVMAMHDAAGLRPAGVRFATESARRLARTGVVVEVSVTDSLSAYDLVDDSGETQQRQAGLGRQTWTARLVPSADGSAWVLG